MRGKPVGFRIALTLLTFVGVGCAKPPQGERASHPTKIGMPLPYRGETPQARQSLESAIGSMRAGRWQEASARLDTAATHAPDWQEIRYQQAVVASRIQDHAATSKRLESVFLRDLPGFVNRYRRDPDLDSFRTGAEGQRLELAIAALVARWHASLGDGEPLLLWTKPIGHIEDSYEIDPPSFFRAGTYHPKDGIFLPAGPIQEHLIDAVLLDGSASVATVQADRYWGLGSALANLRFGVFGAATGDTLPGKLPARDDLGTLDMFGWEKRTTMLMFRAAGVPSDVAPKISARATLQDSIHLGAIDSSGRFRRHFLAEGGFLDSSPSFKKDSGLMHRSSIRTPDGRWDLKVIQSCRWDDGENARSILRHSLMFAPSKGRPRLVSAGDGGASIRRSRTGSMLFQRNDSLFEIGSGSYSIKMAKRLPQGLVLVLPLERKVCFDP